MTIRFDGRVAIVTGAGNGLGRSHALALASRGARVVVNDLGGAADGTGQSSQAARNVVEEIRAAGGEALANGANVTRAEEVRSMVEEAMATWGRIDVLVNNAGILRDKSFAKMTLDDFRAVVDVHLMGSVICTKACWDIMREQNYGRIVFTSSSSGIYGNFGQSNYGAAKAAVVGLMNTLVLEGQKYGIRVNTLVPCAGTRMTEGLLPDEAFDLLRPETVTPGVLYLVSEDGPNRIILAAGAGTFAVAGIYETEGVHIPQGALSPEAVRDNFAEIADPAGHKAFSAGSEQTFKFIQKAMAQGD